MENKSHAFLAGLFTIGLVAAVILTLLWFNRDNTERVPYDLISRSNVNGLNPEAAVRYRGLDVGKVQSIHFDPTNPGQIVIRILVNKDAPMTHSTFANLGFQGVTGIAYVQLDDTGRDKTPLVSTPAHVARLYMRPSFLDELQQRGTTLLNQVQQLSSSLNRLFSRANRDEMMSMVAGIKSAADNLSDLTGKLAPAAQQLPQTLDTLDRTLASTNRLATELSDPHGPLTRNLNSIGQAASQATASLAALQQTTIELSGTLEQESLPRFNALSDQTRTAMQSLGAAADTVSRNPRSLLFGVMPPTPGPGESGFAWPSTVPQN